MIDGEEGWGCCPSIWIYFKASCQAGCWSIIGYLIKNNSCEHKEQTSRHCFLCHLRLLLVSYLNLVATRKQFSILLVKATDFLPLINITCNCNIRKHEKHVILRANQLSELSTTTMDQPIGCDRTEKGNLSELSLPGSRAVRLPNRYQIPIGISFSRDKERNRLVVSPTSCSTRCSDKLIANGLWQFWSSEEPGTSSRFFL